MSSNIQIERLRFPVFAQTLKRQSGKSKQVLNMSFNSEFEKYAVKHKGISSNTLHGYATHMASALTPGMVTGLTPNIIEE